MLRSKQSPDHENFGSQAMQFEIYPVDQGEWVTEEFTSRESLIRFVIRKFTFEGWGSVGVGSA